MLYVIKTANRSSGTETGALTLTNFQAQYQCNNEMPAEQTKPVICGVEWCKGHWLDWTASCISQLAAAVCRWLQVCCLLPVSHILDATAATACVHN